MIQKAKILFFCMIFVVSGVFGQKKASLKYNFMPLIFKKADFNLSGCGDTVYFRSCWSRKKFEKYYRNPKCDSISTPPISFINSSSINVIIPNFYTQNFGFFCKKEMQLQKTIKFPFVFRLGSVEMCDRLEGKGK
jgi:hypothetical protein